MLLFTTCLDYAHFSHEEKSPVQVSVIWLLLQNTPCYSEHAKPPPRNTHASHPTLLMTKEYFRKKEKFGAEHKLWSQAH